MLWADCNTERTRSLLSSSLHSLTDWFTSNATGIHFAFPPFSQGKEKNDFLLIFAFWLIKMSLSTQESTEDENYVFVGSMDHARSLSNILKAIHFKDVSGVLYYRPDPLADRVRAQAVQFRLQKV